MTEVQDLMSRDVVTLLKKHTVEQARRLLKEHKVSALPVLGDNGRLRGIVSAVDLAADLENTTPITEVMSEDVFAIAGDDDARRAAQVMENQKIHHVVVIKDGKVEGILSSFDLLRLIDTEPE